MVKIFDLKNIKVDIYESPALSVVELESEGVICASGQFDPYEEDTLDW